MSLVAHFLNVGQGDCNIIEFPSGRVAMVDIHNLKILDRDTRSEVLQEYHESIDYLAARGSGLFTVAELDERFLKQEQARLTDPLAYYDARIGKDRDIFRMIVTHPDMDHMTGLYRLHEQEKSKAILNFWHTGTDDFNLAHTTEEEWKSCPYDQRDWESYKKLRAGGTGCPTSLMNYKGAAGNYWTEDGVEILSPTSTLARLAVEREQPNIISLVLKISYQGRSIILGGDATSDETWPAIHASTEIGKIDVLKASHHGRKTGYHQPSIEKLAPWLTITSVGEKEHDATESYRRYSDYTVSLRKAGDIQITIADDGRLYYSPNAAEHWKAKRTAASPLARFAV